MKRFSERRLMDGGWQNMPLQHEERLKMWVRRLRVDNVKQPT